MEQKDYIRKVIQLYFGKKFSQNGKILFGRWLRANNHNLQKTEVLKELWEQSSDASVEDSLMDWNLLKSRLQEEEKSRFVQFKLYTWFRYVAVVALVVLTAGVTYWVTDASQTAVTTEMVEVFVPYGDDRNIVLPDNTKVWIAPGTILVYPKSFDKFNTRTVYLTGAGSFSVEKNREKPFIVKTNYLTVKALGTVFTVNSYPNDFETKTTLEEGSVCVDINLNKDKSSILKPNQQLVYSHKTGEVVVSKVDATAYKMIRNGFLVFENASFNEVIKTLERRFKVTFQYDSHKYIHGTYNVKYTSDETLDNILSVLQSLTGFRYKIVGNEVLIN